MVNVKYLLKYVLFYTLSSAAFVFCSPVNAQYGLGFAGQEVVQDQRTGLVLNADKDFCFEESFELAFDMSFLPNRADYFGYIFRIIVNDHQNIDLVYDKNSKSKHFKIVLDDTFSSINFDIDTSKLFSSWSQLRLRVDVSKQELTFGVDALEWSEKIGLPSGKSCVKVFFGANKYKDFKTTDLPAMKLRKVSVHEDQKQPYSWLLDENDGLQALDINKGLKAEVFNPNWIKKLHDEWQLLRMLTASGEASVAFDSKNERVYLVGSDSLICYDIPSGTTIPYAYASGSFHLANGNQSVYDTLRNQILNISVDQQTVSVFDFESKTWSALFQQTADGTHFLHFNKYYHPSDRTLYMFGGYGHFTYKNAIQTYNFSTNTWKLAKSNSAAFTPRYLAALGATSNGAYILGGYGSASGQQLLNAKNTYDLLFFDVKTHNFSHIFDLKIDTEDVTFANSLIVDGKSRSYYALIFPKHKYNSTLQLIKGSLEKNTLISLGNGIPYQFHDTQSYADLFYCRAGQRFIAVTLFYDEKGSTSAQLYSLFYPPNEGITTKTNTNTRMPVYIWYVLGVGILVFCFVVIKINKRKKYIKNKIFVRPVQAAPEIPDIIGQLTKESEPKLKNAIFLFGQDLQLFDRDGNNITRSFTPLLKEMFLVILLWSIRWGSGIRSEKLMELLWPDKSADSARNNRSVNITKLKSLLEQMDQCSVSHERGFWKIDMDERMLYVDYKEYLSIVNNKTLLNKDQITKLSAIVQRGAFLSQLEFEWLDPFKSEISNEVIDTYIHFENSVSISDDPEFMVQLANNIFYFDPVNEEAMVIKCKALAYLGKHSLATQAFENFSKEYKLIYGSDFGRNFREVVS